jgi:hypothetical protein
MAPRSESASHRVKRWFDRITTAEKGRDAWEKRFQPKKLQDYWEGFQWGEMPDEDKLSKYTINQVYGAIEAEKPSLMFQNPIIKMTPRPTKADDFGSTMLAQAQLCQDTVQTFIDDLRTDFQLQTTLALHESYFRFGVVEVGYSADFIDNPNAGKPVLKGDSNDPMIDRTGETVKQPEKVIKEGSESVYVKRIPAASFLVSISGKNRVTDNDWIGYSEWHYLEDLKRNPNYENLSDVKPTGIITEKLRGGETLSREDMEKRHGMTRIWKLWDLREKKRYVIAEGHTKFLLDGAPFTVFPFAVLKFHERLDEFYPLPPVFNWKGPQDELNETREMQRVHRRRFTRRYTYRTGSMEIGELEKLESGEDGVYAAHNGAPGEQPLQPVPDAPLDGAIWNNLAAVKEDFTQVSGSPSESRGVPLASTATQANIINTRTQIRESSQRVAVSQWLARICRIMLETLREKMTLPFVIYKNVDLTSPAAEEEVLEVSMLWQAITADQLGEIDLDIVIDMASLSPITQDAQAQQWDQMLMRLSNPAIQALIAPNIFLLRRTLMINGIRNETEIRAFAESLQATYLAQQMAAMAGSGSPTAGKGEPSEAAPVMPQAGVPTGATGMQ